MIDAADETQRILAVDDNAFTLRIVKHTLEQSGYLVVTAVSGQDALTLIKRHGMPHLAIVDLHMPIMSGFEFCHQVQKLIIVIVQTYNRVSQFRIRDYTNSF